MCEIHPHTHTCTHKYTIAPTYTSLQEIKHFLLHLAQDVRLVTQRVSVYYE